MQGRPPPEHMTQPSYSRCYPNSRTFQDPPMLTQRVSYYKQHKLAKTKRIVARLSKICVNVSGGFEGSRPTRGVGYFKKVTLQLANKLTVFQLKVLAFLSLF